MNERNELLKNVKGIYTPLQELIANELDAEFADKAAAELASLQAENARLKHMVGQYGFVVTLNGGSGFRYLRCRQCNGDNMSATSNELNSNNVRHAEDCAFAAALSGEPS